MTRSQPRLVVAALRGGSGKTTVSLGMTAAWRRQGLRVSPFKKGPDYIDTGWLALAARKPAYNLDPYLMTSDQILRSFAYRAGQGTDIVVIEGNRGLYDGADDSGTYSTAELAKLLAAPTLLVVDCTKVTRTLAAVVWGCRQFDPDIHLAGVILNQVATARQESLVRRTIEEASGVPVLGAIPRVDAHDLPERHLGLVPHQEHPAAAKALDIAADLAEEYLDLAALLEVAHTAPNLNGIPGDAWCVPARPRDRSVRVGVIQDSAFQFYYPENIEALERLGAKVQVFSSLNENRLPDVDALYLGGGFPESHAEILAGNQGLREDIRRASEEGMPIYAECGGLMFLGQALVLGDRTFPMAGVFPVTFGVEKKPQGHGYTHVKADRTNPFYAPGEKVTGHEFHYSRPLAYDPDQIRLVLNVERGHGFAQGRDGLSVHNTLALYTHVHAFTSTRWAEALVDLAIRRKEDQTLAPENPGGVLKESS